MALPLWAGSSLVSPSMPNTTITLYDGSLGGRPDEQGLFFVNLPPGSASHTFASGLTTLDTTISNGIYAGYPMEPTTVITVPVMERTETYTLTFSVQIESEAHTSNDRAGFSLIALSNDVKGIELGFWSNEIWAQHDDTTGNLFTHAEGVSIATSALTTYTLMIITDTYTLAASGTPILTGPLRDYSNFVGPIDPYETPNFIFLGDDTTSAQASIKFRYLAVTVPQPPQPTSTSTATSTSGPSATPTNTPTQIPGATNTHTPTPTVTGTILPPTVTATPTHTPEATNTPTPTGMPDLELFYLPFISW
jgi:hypothetical protein